MHKEDLIKIPEDKILNIAPERRETDRRQRNSDLANHAKKKIETTDLNLTIGSLLYTIVFTVPWIMGIVIAQGWYKVVAIFMFPYGWYLTVERFMQLSGII